MQPKKDNSFDEHLKEILSREFKGDFHTLTQNEIKDKLRNFFYQAFLIDLADIQIYHRENEDGSVIKFSLEGYGYRDGEALDPSEELLEEE